MGSEQNPNSEAEIKIKTQSVVSGTNNEQSEENDGPIDFFNEHGSYQFSGINP